MTNPPADDYSGLPPDTRRSDRRPVTGATRSVVALLVPLSGIVFIVIGALLAAVVAKDSNRSSSLIAFIGGLSTGVTSAGAIALGLGIVYLAWVVTHPTRG